MGSPIGGSLHCSVGVLVVTIPRQCRVAYSQLMVQTERGNGVSDLMQALYDDGSNEAAFFKGFDGFRTVA